MTGARLLRNGIGELLVSSIRETVFFSTVDGELRQWLELGLRWQGWRAGLRVEVRAGGRSVVSHVPLMGGTEITAQCPAPVLWPGDADADARVVFTEGGRTTEAAVTVGTHRPWTIYLISDLCADDTWAYSGLAEHDRDDYLTSLAELNAGEGNRYNFATTYQVERFRRQASPGEWRALERAFRGGRFYATPVPNQFLCGALNLAAYPLLLEPYRRLCLEGVGLRDEAVRDAYHMEAPTWTNGLANLFACCGFRSFAKSLLQAGAPWIDELRRLPRLTRLRVAPGRYVYLLLRCGDYSEGMPVLPGLPHAETFLHERVIPEHEQLGDAYPVSAIPLVGTYSDLFPGAREWTKAKVEAVARYDSNWWDYPRLVNATWPQFFDHVEAEAGPPDKPRRKGLVTVGGATGSAWEAWPLRIQRESAAFRRAQRDVVSLRTICAMLGLRDRRTQEALDTALEECVHLADHAWNGSSDGSKALNLDIRRRRLARLSDGVRTVRSTLLGSTGLEAGSRVAVANPLPWARTCLVELPEGLTLADPKSRAECPVADGRAVVRNVPAFGVRAMRLCPAGASGGAHEPPAEPVLPCDRMAPVLLLDGREAACEGGWKGGRGRWQAGPFAVTADLRRAAAVDADEVVIGVAGVPPSGSYALRWRFDLPWKRCRWRAETGGGFADLAPSSRGGDLLGGVAGACCSVGEGLTAIGPGERGSFDFALAESGICGPGGPTTELARSDPGKLLSPGYRSSGVMRGRTTEGVLDWYLLATDPLPHEQIPDQAGTRAWTFHCALRRRRGGPDDASLYRFAAGYCRPGELVSDRRACRLGRPWLVTGGSSRVLVLAAACRGGAVWIDLYNTSRRKAAVRLGGPAVAGRKLEAADMLSRPRGAVRDATVELAPEAFARVIAR